MLCDLVERAQRGEEAPMVELIQKFSDLFKKYARKLNYEDAYQDIVVFFIELIKSFKLEKLQCKKDEIIVSYINVSITNFYKKSIGKLIRCFSNGCVILFHNNFIYEEETFRTRSFMPCRDGCYRIYDYPQVFR